MSTTSRCTLAFCHVEAGGIADNVRTMCGILAALGVQGDRKDSRVKVVRASQLQRHRGPDSTTVWESTDGGNFLAFERLNIVDATEAGRCEELSSRLPATRRSADHALSFPVQLTCAAPLCNSSCYISIPTAHCMLRGIELSPC